MLNVYVRGADGQIAKAEDGAHAIAAANAIWFDLLDPSAAEEEIVEKAIGMDVPTKAERAALEDSARFYEENGALVLTATMLSSREGGRYASDAASFVLAAGKLVTVRQLESRAFQIGADRASARIQHAEDASAVFMAVLEGLIERAADILQETTARAQSLSRRVFVTDGEGPNMNRVLSELGVLGGVVALCHDSLVSLERLAAFAQHICDRHALPGPRLGAFAHDADQLERTADALQNHLTFLLDAALGLVAARQNATLQRLSVAAMAFLPSTLLAGVFGMNFKAMTIFDAPWGPWLCFALMIAATLAALAYARARHWI